MTKTKKYKRKSTLKVLLLKHIVKISSTIRQDAVNLIENTSEFGGEIDLDRVEILHGMVCDLGHLCNLVGEAFEESIIEIEKRYNK